MIWKQIGKERGKTWKKREQEGKARFLNYMNALGHEAYANSSVSYSNLTATPWVISQYGVYNYVGLTDGGTWTGNGITSSVAPYRRLNTLVVRIPKNVYYENESDFSLVYNSEWSYWNVTTDEKTGEKIGGLKYSQYKKRGLNGTNDIILSYKLPLTNDYGESYTFASPENFEWKSNDTITNQNDSTTTEIKNFCALNYAKAVLAADLGSGIENLVRGLCMYNLMADAYFNK